MVTIEPQLKNGTYKITIPNPNPNNTQHATQTLFQQIIHDKELVQLLTSETNLQKISHRLEYNYTTTNKKGQTLTKATKLNTTPQQALNEITQLLHTTRIYEYGVTNQQGWTIDIHRKGIPNTKTLTITFRKQP